MIKVSIDLDQIYSNQHVYPVGESFEEESMVGQGSNHAIECLKQEVAVLRQLCCEYIVTFYHEIHMAGIYGFCMEYCPKGSLADLIQRNGCLSEEEIQVVMKQMLLSLAYLMKNRIVHRYASFVSGFE